MNTRLDNYLDEKGAIPMDRNILKDYAASMKERTVPDIERKARENNQRAAERRFSAGFVRKEVKVRMNNDMIEMVKGPLTGLRIKKEAIKQGVDMRENFMLVLTDEKGTSRVIGDRDTVTIRRRISFTAVDPYDNG